MAGTMYAMPLSGKECVDGTQNRISDIGWRGEAGLHREGGEEPWGKLG